MKNYIRVGGLLHFFDDSDPGDRERAKKFVSFTPPGNRDPVIFRRCQGLEGLQEVGECPSNFFEVTFLSGAQTYYWFRPRLEPSINIAWYNAWQQASGNINMIRIRFPIDIKGPWSVTKSIYPSEEKLDQLAAKAVA